jgi:hypothetical protein
MDNMRKNIKKIIIVGVMTVSIFTLIGCGQTKEDLKEEIKQEIKTEEVQTKVDNEQAKEDEKKSIEDKLKEDIVTKEQFSEFESMVAEYQKIESTTLAFTLSPDVSSYKTLEECKKTKEQLDMVRDKLFSICPSSLKESFTNYINLKDEIFDTVSKTNQFDKEKTSEMTEAMGVFQKEFYALKKLKS